MDDDWNGCDACGRKSCPGEYGHPPYPCGGPREPEEPPDWRE